MKRRQFLRGLGLGAVVGGALPAAVAKAQPTQFRWRMVTSWPPGFPVLQEGAERFAKRIDEVSQGRLKIEVFAGGVLVPALGGFDAIRQGTVEAGSSASYYWAGQVPAAQFFTAVPYGLTVEDMQTWLYGADALELWNEIYAKVGLYALPMLNTGVQMGGWFKKELKSLDDLKGLKMRIPGLGGKVMAKLGVAVTLLPAAEIVPALERGTIDAAEWVSPLHDLLLGFPKVAKFYYYPGWHEPGAQAELMINKRAWDALPKELQGMVHAVANEINIWSYAEFERRNAAALARIKREFPDVRILPFPDALLREFRRQTEVVLGEEAAADRTGDFRRVYDAYLKFRSEQKDWVEIAQRAYFKAEELR
ncbi:MAG: TRAP transporter substrate-binding protein DctP [Candidatus Bipolaricaulota bacterium]|nr:TRAP transporter substrate-binding protein DctP [Candidatus Bipolaricaulota bacterium]MCS7274536.1 TRAP transporter substrate-binding protein DctP [Candidatus Bipolaricaulota bacterium]MDW8111219.1 TRAP transporter substrate-binding protein DctP [Candidatus Bipolaricaulota bacterium]MDW8329450.1 TRAP transporter substrate-binding protein DctP [Candidatus Bipolaricaulota bacterium]